MPETLSDISSGFLDILDSLEAVFVVLSAILSPIN